MIGAYVESEKLKSGCLVCIALLSPCIYSEFEMQHVPF